MSTTYSYEDVVADAEASESGIAHRLLDAGETAWNPASTKHDLTGPLRVTYRRFPDGGWTAITSPRS